MNLTERYRPGDSLVHQLDPRVKVVTTLLLITGITLTPARAWPLYPLLWMLVAVIARAAHVNVLRLARQGGIALPFALAAVTLLFTTPGDPLVEIAGLSVTGAGLVRFGGIVAKSWLAVQVALLLAITTPFTDLLWALGSLRVPQTLVAILSFMYRYLFTLQDEAARLIRARAARSGSAAGRRSGGGLAWRAQVTGSMAGSLFLRSAERSERVYAAMVARGYAGQLRVLDPPPLTRRAVLLGALPVLALAVLEALALTV